MKIPATFLPPPTPVKKKLSVTSHNVPHIKTCKLIAEGSFYKIFLTENGTVLRVSKRKAEDFEESRILESFENPFINKMIKWWIEDSNLYFEMEPCDFNLKERSTRIEKFFKKDGRGGMEKYYYNRCYKEKISSASITNNDINTSCVKRIRKGSNENKTRPLSNNIDTIPGFSSDANLDTFDSDVNASDTSLLLMSLSNVNNATDNANSTVHTIADPFSETIVPCSTSLVLSDTDSTSSQAIDNSIKSGNILSNLTIPFWVKLMMLQLSNALAYVHSKRIVHMDVKPENILVKIAEKDITFQLCDFNISRIGEGPFVLDGDKVYMAPEILKNKCFFKSDVYSLGLVYLELVNDTALPTSGEEYRKLRKNNFEGWKIDEIGRRMLEKNPSVRCSAKEVEEYFHNILAKGNG